MSSTTKTGEVFLKDYRRPGFAVDTVDLGFDLDPHNTIVTARLGLRRQQSGAALWLDGEGLTLLAIAVDGVPLPPERYTVEAHGLTVHGLPDNCVLETTVKIVPIENTALSGLYVSNGNFYTQCEAEGFRRITYFPDRPDVMARYTVTIIAPKSSSPPVALSNGNSTGSHIRDDGRLSITWVDPHPKPCYLFALVAGALISVTDQFRTRSGRAIDLAIWVRRGDEDKCAHAMQSLQASMRWDEEAFGLEYDLDVFNIAAVSDFNMGAMENKGLNIFNTKLVLARPDTATDADYERIESVIAHEYFHNWTGNRVTCRDWFQLSLKEGLTVFRDQEFSADMHSAAVKRISDVERLRAAQFPEDAGPLAHPVRPDRYRKIDNFYTATVYEKGAEVIRMLRTLIGREAFRRGFDLYIARNDNSAATIEDFVGAMQEASGQDLGHFMRWYDQAGTPTVTLRDHYDAEHRRYTLTLRQETPPTPNQPVKQPLTIPVVAGLLGPDGDEIAARTLVLTEAEQSFVFEDIATLPVPSLLRGFSAPVKLAGVSRERLRFLATHDGDPFVRWDSGQRYMAETLLDAVAAGALPDTAGLETIIAAALAGQARDPAFAAWVVMLPSADFLAEQMTVVDTDGIAEVRRAAQAAIGRALATRFQELYEHLADPAPYQPESKAIARRLLRNIALGYLAAADAETGARLAYAQFSAGGSMTDVAAALSVLSRLDVPERTQALDGFYARWHGDPLVLDKWFMIQALSSLPGTIQTVRALTGHRDFDLRTPNRVRALMTSFSTGNPKWFHSLDGEGYTLLTDTLLALDPLNGQVAARMVAPLGQWRRHIPARQTLMRAALQRILGTPGLSDNTAEMAGRALA